MIADLTGYSDSKIRNSFSDKPPYLMGTEIFTDNVFMVAEGQIVGAGKEEDGTYSVSVQINDNEMLRYCHLKNRQFGLAYHICKGIKIGDAKEYVRFEYCTSWQGVSKFPVRIAQHRFFRQDPTDILEGRYSILRDAKREQHHRSACATPDYKNDIMKREFGDNSGMLKSLTGV